MNEGIAVLSRSVAYKSSYQQNNYQGIGLTPLFKTMTGCVRLGQSKVLWETPPSLSPVLWLPWGQIRIDSEAPMTM